MRVLRTFAVLCFSLVSLAGQAADSALITALKGKVQRNDGTASGAVEAFAKLRKGDVLTLAKGAQVQIVYFDNGRQEQWSGQGKVEVGDQESLTQGLGVPEVKQLPLVMVKQLARTPSLDSQGRAGALRLRSVPTPESIAKIEETYRKLRSESAPGDKNPELYLLSGMFEMRELARVEQILVNLKKTHPGDMEVKFLASLYGKAIKDVRQAEAATTE